MVGCCVGVLSLRILSVAARKDDSSRLCDTDQS